MSASSADTPGRYLELPGRGRVYFHDIAGPEGAPTVLLLHGLAATARLNWEPSFGPLSEHFRVVSLDHRGHGRGMRTRRFRLADCADDAMALVDTLGVGHLIVVGYSMGGPIASLAWHRHAERIDGLVLCATARDFSTRERARASRVVMPMASRTARLLPGSVRNSMVLRMLERVEEPGLRAKLIEEMGKTDPAAVLEAAGALARFSARRWIGQINIPSAVIVTTRDELVPPERQRELAGSIPGAEEYEVEADHSACVSRADLFVPTLVRACRSVMRRGAVRR